MMKIVLSVLLMAGFSAASHELDREQTVSPQQIQKAKELPQTIVVRVSKKDPSQVEVVHLKEKLAAGKKVANLKFEKMAMNAEVTGLAYDSGNELDARSSTSSWSFGIYYQPSYSYARPYTRSYSRYDYGYRRPAYDYDYSYRRPAYRSSYYEPTYNYYGYRYNYRSYYSYSDSNYYYDYCAWYY